MTRNFWSIPIPPHASLPHDVYRMAQKRNKEKQSFVLLNSKEDQLQESPVADSPRNRGQRQHNYSHWAQNEQKGSAKHIIKTFRKNNSSCTKVILNQCRAKWLCSHTGLLSSNGGKYFPAADAGLFIQKYKNVVFYSFYKGRLPYGIW